MIKRIFDFVLSFIGLLVLSPMIIIVGVLVKMTSRSGVLYVQTRTGKNRKPFKLVKFRTMTTAADKKGPLITAGGDSRITGIGRILRKTKLDELPELWNVLKDDMSLVGPRPEIPKYVEFHRDKWEKVLSVRPGITDFATLQFRDEESVLKEAIDVERAYIEVVLPIKLSLALQYVEHHSLGLDLKILVQTVWGITLGRYVAKPSDSLAKKAIEQIKVLNRTINSKQK